MEGMHTPLAPAASMSPGAAGASASFPLSGAGPTKPPQRLPGISPQDLDMQFPIHNTLVDSQNPSGSAGEGSHGDHRAFKRLRTTGDNSKNYSRSAGGGGSPAPPAPAAAVYSREEAEKHGRYTAKACGLNPYGLSEDEEGLLPPGAEEDIYARVRNQVLLRWRSNCSERLLLEDALEDFKGEKDKAYALAAWKFLDTMGYINFGVSPDIQHVVQTSSESRGTVIVVGAGCAGLAAARQLRARGYRVTIVEGRARPGGRVYTARLSGPSGMGPAVADVGGSILTGIDGNPLAVVAKQLGLPLVHIRDNTPLFMPDGSPADPELDNLVERHFNDRLMEECVQMRAKPSEASFLSMGSALESLWRLRYRALRNILPGGAADAAAARQLFDWHMANLEFANASQLKDLSLVHWDQDDPNELPGAHCFIPGCNGRWMQSLVEGLLIFYNSPVQQIRYCKTGVAVHTSNRVFIADAVVVTSPLGVLKRDAIKFNPPLSTRKRSAMARLGFGNLNKVIMLFPHVFWGNEHDMFGHVSEDPQLRGEGFLFYSYAHISGGAQLTALVCGAAAGAHEARPAGDSASRIMTVLRDIFEPRGVVVPAPLQVIVTAWGSDPMAYGAYSSMPVGTQGGPDYDAFGESVGGRVFFAGEATSRRYPATMHGAFFTGLWTAANVDASLSRAADRVQMKNAAVAVLTNPRPLSLLQMANNKLSVTSQMQVLFEDPLHPPDLEFGSFAAVMGPPGTPYADKALLRINFEKTIKNVQDGTKQQPLQNQHNSNMPMVTYIIISKQLAEGLSDCAGDEMRIAMLSAMPGVNLVGRDCIPIAATALASLVLQARRGKERASAILVAGSAKPVAGAAAVAAPIIAGVGGTA